MLPKNPNITYITYSWGQTYAPVVVPEVRQVPMLAFYPPQVEISAHNFRSKNIAEYQAYIQLFIKIGK